MHQSRGPFGFHINIPKLDLKAGNVEGHRLVFKPREDIYKLKSVLSADAEGIPSFEDLLEDLVGSKLARLNQMVQIGLQSMPN